MKAGLWEVNTNTASRLSFAWVPKGVKLDQLNGDDLAIFKRALRWQRKRAVEMLLPGERVSACFAVRIKLSVEVHYSPKAKRANYGGLLICGRVWPCPICAAKITERRRVELENADSSGLSSFMVTITLQHNVKERLAKLNNDLGEAWRIVTAGRGWQMLKAKFDIVGSVTGREVTFGIDNGWHPHLHILYYSRLSLEKIDTDELKKFITERFINALAKFGRYASPIHGVNVIKGEDLTGMYLVKAGLEDNKKSTWSLVSELTKGAVKSGMKHGDHYTPFQLLDLYLCNDLVAGKRFIEYANAMKRKKQLTYSRGLRELLKIGVESTDQELAEAADQESRLFALLSDEHWNIILKRGKRGTLLEVASSGKYDLFVAYCKTLGITDLLQLP